MKHLAPRDLSIVQVSIPLRLVNPLPRKASSPISVMIVDIPTRSVRLVHPIVLPLTVISPKHPFGIFDTLPRPEILVKDLQPAKQLSPTEEIVPKPSMLVKDVHLWKHCSGSEVIFGRQLTVVPETS